MPAVVRLDFGCTRTAGVDGTRYTTIGSGPSSARGISVLGTVGDDTLPRPARVETPRPSGLGLRAGASFDDIVRAYLDDGMPGLDSPRRDRAVASLPLPLPVIRTARRRAMVTALLPWGCWRETPPGGNA